MLELSRGWHSAEIEELVEEALEDVIAPLVYAEALFLIDEHLREGRRVFIVSASPQEVVRPLAHYIGVDEVVATRSRMDAAGYFTGELEFYAYGEGKVEEIERIAQRDELSLADSYAYSDSATDLPLLEAVGNPHAVNPDKELRAVAEEKGWPILVFSRQVSLRTRLTKPVPIISGATVAAGVGVLVAAAIIRARKKR
jgi:HAD superfamily hydrolase (TIGR01490 family)